MWMFRYFDTLLQASQPGEFVALAEAWPGPQLPAGAAALSPGVAGSLGRPSDGGHVLLYRGAAFVAERAAGEPVCKAPSETCCLRQPLQPP